MTPLLVVVGPTASGKTELSLRLAEALNGEIVGADSVQIYRYFDIGAAKPSEAELGRAPHHLIGTLSPDDEVEASRYVEMADAAIADIRARGRQPIVCGGTFLWVRALLHGLADAPAKDAAVRRRHEELAKREGRAALHAELAERDPPTAARLHPNDFVRVSRALEVWELSGRRMSALQAAHGFRDERHPARLIAPAWPRPEYDARVEARARAMLDAGFLEEVEALVARGFGEARAMSAVGYKQARAALSSGEVDREALALEITRATRTFARRQRTWLRDRPIEWLEGAWLGEPARFDAWLEGLVARVQSDNDASTSARNDSGEKP